MNLRFRVVLVFFFLYAAVTVVKSQGAPGEKKNPFPPFPAVLKQPGKSPSFKDVYGGANSSAILQALRARGKDTQEHMRKLRKWFNNIAIDVQRRRDDSDGSECTLRGQPWIKEAKLYQTDRNFDEVKESCATRTEHDDRENKTLAFQYLEKTANIFSEAAKAAISSDKNLSRIWNAERVQPIVKLKYKSSGDQECELNYLMAIKVRSIWYIAAAGTSSGPNRGGKRFDVVEHVPADIGNPNLLSLPMRLIPYNTNGVGNEDRENYANRSGWYTTSFSKTTGSAQISRIHRMRYDDNRALQRALEENILAVDQANDAITYANMAILILPLFMSFIPVALIADLSEAATLFYVLLTDVFAAVPFVIKGVELVLTGTTEQRASETWIMGEDGAGQIAETWTAKCQPVEKFRTIGAVVIAIGIASILSGIFIEIIARRWMSYRRDKGEQPEPFGPALLRMDAYIPVGAGYMQDYNDEMSPNIMADLPPAPPPAASGSASSRISNLFSGLLMNQRRRRRSDDRPNSNTDTNTNTSPTAVQTSNSQSTPQTQVTGAVIGMRRRGSSNPNIEGNLGEP